MPRKNKAAVALGRRGGSSTSEAKAAAARANGAKGGRPRTVAAEPEIRLWTAWAEAAGVTLEQFSRRAIEELADRLGVRNVTGADGTGRDAVSFPVDEPKRLG